MVLLLEAKLLIMHIKLWLYCAVFFISCNHSKTDDLAADQALSSTMKTLKKGEKVSIAEDLPIVFTKREDFLQDVANNRSLALQFVIVSGGKLNLEGWSALNNGNKTFGTNANIKFELGDISGVRLEEGDHLGTITIPADGIKKLFRFLSHPPGNSYGFLILAPIKNDQQITYRIFVDNQPPLSAGIWQTSTSKSFTAVSANPTPPRNN